jgi:hypothetical protein
VCLDSINNTFAPSYYLFVALFLAFTLLPFLAVNLSLCVPCLSSPGCSPMLLLNADTLQLETFAGNKIPAYAILSHVWGLPKDDVSFEDMRAGAAEQKPGYFKLQKSCAIAVQDGLKYIWIDTCCIDKGSSAELSEAINSMFRYYAESKICYAYLEDVSSSTPDACFAESKWFTRG